MDGQAGEHPQPVPSTALARLLGVAVLPTPAASTHGPNKRPIKVVYVTMLLGPDKSWQITCTFLYGNARLKSCFDTYIPGVA